MKGIEILVSNNIFHFPSMQSCGMFQLRKWGGVMLIWKVELLQPWNGVGSLLTWKVELLPIWRRQRNLLWPKETLCRGLCPLFNKTQFLHYYHSFF